MKSRPGKSAVLATGLLAVAVIATGCALITTSGTGTVTITSDLSSTANTVAYVCPGRTSTCSSTDPYEYTFSPPLGTVEVVVTPGFPVKDTSGNSVGLPAGEYTVGIYGSLLISDPPTEQGTVFIDVFSTQERDLTIWHKSTGRESASSTCADGWETSWAAWPNSGSGGFVCNNQSYAYYPDEPVPSQNSGERATPWQQSIGRATSETECPVGYEPGWAQWPNKYTGGHTCERTLG